MDPGHKPQGNLERLKDVFDIPLLLINSRKTVENLLLYGRNDLPCSVNVKIFHLVFDFVRKTARFAN